MKAEPQQLPVAPQQPQAPLAQLTRLRLAPWLQLVAPQLRRVAPPQRVVLPLQEAPLLHPAPLLRQARRARLLPRRLQQEALVPPQQQPLRQQGPQWQPQPGPPRQRRPLQKPVAPRLLPLLAQERQQHQPASLPIWCFRRVPPRIISPITH